MGRCGGRRASGWCLDGAGYSPLSAPAQLHEETRDMRPSGRAPDQMRPIAIETAFTIHAEGSVLVAFGHTQVLVTASVEAKVPPFLRGKGQGWVTGEYGMLPTSEGGRDGDGVVSTG